MTAHSHHIFKEPEEWTVVIILWPHHGQHPVIFKEQPACALWKQRQKKTNETPLKTHLLGQWIG
jgi:hypothetical protein